LRVPPPGPSDQYAKAQAQAQLDKADCTVPHGEQLTQRLAANALYARQAAAAAKAREVAAAKTPHATTPSSLPTTPQN
jgi:hypothetical protein